MVGVPGRSKACQTCKRRHIVCDLEHLKQVACGPCTKSKRACNYPRNHIFVNHDEGTHKTVYRKADGERDRVDRGVSSRQRADFNESKSSKVDAASSDSCLMSYSSTTLPVDVPATALVRQQFLASAQKVIYTGNRAETEFPHFWSAAITGQSLDSLASRTSPALACYTAWMGRQDEDPYLVEASRKLYIQGLQEVQQSVNDPDTALLDETLSACIGLILYEALECPDGGYSAYHKHIDGCSALIKLRGIDAHRDGVGHDLFRGFRYIAIIKALQDHRGSYLCSPAWSELPFSIHAKDTHDRLLDILGTGASFLAESDRLATLPPSMIVAALLSMDDRLVDLSDQMEALYAELESGHKGPLFWSSSPSCKLLDGQPGHILSTDDFRATICFPNQETARILTLYWAQQTLLRMGRGEIRMGLAGLAAARMVEGHAERVNRSLSIPAKPTIQCAHLVLRSYDYCRGSQSTLLRYSVPLNITLDVLANKPEQYPEEINFAKEIKRHISQRHLRITQYTRTLKHVKEV